MVYFPSHGANSPWFQMVKELSESAQGTARTLYECRGWTVHHNTDLWRMAGPVDGASYVWPLGSRQYGSQRIQHDLSVHRTSGSNHRTSSRRTLFGRHRRSTDHPAIFRMFHQEIEEEIGCPLQSRISSFQECRLLRLSQGIGFGASCRIRAV